MPIILPSVLSTQLESLLQNDDLQAEKGSGPGNTENDSAVTFIWRFPCFCYDYGTQCFECWLCLRNQIFA
jgi:hypothetical protein